MLYDHKDEIALGISFDYGSNHNAREIPYAKMHCERLGIKHITINLDFMHQYFKSSLLDGADAIPEGHYADDRIIDIDILMYDDLHINTPELTLPHPLMKERDFVMIPLSEIFF